MRRLASGPPWSATEAGYGTGASSPKAPRPRASPAGRLLQLEGRRADAPRYRLLPFEAELGLARLPEPSRGDVFFDIEADPFVGHAGLEYLFGYVLLDSHGAPDYRAVWATNSDAEKRGFESFIDMLMERWREHAGMHVYHFSPYEPGALKRLMGRHATREDAVDRLLRGERFVDLLGVGSRCSGRDRFRSGRKRVFEVVLRHVYGCHRAGDGEGDKVLRKVIKEEDRGDECLGLLYV